MERRKQKVNLLYLKKIFRLKLIIKTYVIKLILIQEVQQGKNSTKHTYINDLADDYITQPQESEA